VARKFLIEKSHSEIVSKGTLFKVLKFIDREDPGTPLLLMDREKIKEKAALIGSGIAHARGFYAMKANPDPEVVRVVRECGMGFEIASEGELRVLQDLGVGPENIITSNPVKSVGFLRAAAAWGIRHYAFDSLAEVDKMAASVPSAKLFVRLSVPNEGSDWPLSRKFGVELDEAVSLMRYAAAKGLRPAGITFHVGSQCLSKYSWNTALYKAKTLWDMCEAEGMRLETLNIGGGYPVSYTRSVVAIQEIEGNIDRLVRDHFPTGTGVFIEPGRAVVGDAGVLVASVIGKALRRNEHWLSLDAGVFNGLMESVGGITYAFIPEDTGERKRSSRSYVVAGPSCDSFDVIQREVRLPEPGVGDLVLILSAGAYTTAYASEFNGFPIPRTILM
jgi:ornithine decarboxylase